MSTKIYDGYIIKGVDTIDELFNFISQVRTTLLEAVEERSASLFYNTTVEECDKLMCGIQLTEQSWYNRSLRAYGVDVEKTDRKTYNQSPFFRIVFLRAGDKLLAQYQGNVKAAQKAWVNFEQVHFYGYWDDTDKDEACTDAEWETRELDWDKAFSFSYVPIQNGLMLDPVSFFETVPSNMLTHSAIDMSACMSKRIDKVARELQYEHYYEQLDKTVVDYSIYSNMMHWCETDEGKKIYEYYAKKVKWRLLRNVKTALRAYCRELFMPIKKYGM